MKNPASLFKNGEKNCYLLTDRFYRRYFCDVDIPEGVVLLDANGVTCFTDARYFSAVKLPLTRASVTPVLLKGFETVSEHIVKSGYQKIYIDFDTTTVRDFEKYKGVLPDILDGSKNLQILRSVKSESELDNIRKACEITQKAYYQTLKIVREGMTEIELKEVLCSLYLEYGAEGEVFDTIVAFGENGAIPHHQTGETRLKKGMPILIDTGCKVNGYISDYTRTAFFGQPPKKFIDCYNAVKKANELAIEKITDGTKTFVADGYARDYLKEVGLAEYFTHSLGHGVGLEVHEYPTLSPKTDDEIRNGTVFTIEPGVYFDGEFGIRIEDTVALIDGKTVRLYTDNKELIIL